MSETIQQGPTQKSLGWRLFTIFLGMILALVLAWRGHLGWHAFHLVRLAHSLQADPTQIRPETLVSLVEEAAGDVGAIHQDLSPLFPVFDALQGLPWAGPYLGQVEPLVRYADGRSSRPGKKSVWGWNPC